LGLGEQMTSALQASLEVASARSRGKHFSFGPPNEKCVLAPRLPASLLNQGLGSRLGPGLDPKGLGKAGFWHKKLGGWMVDRGRLATIVPAR